MHTPEGFAPAHVLPAKLDAGAIAFAFRGDKVLVTDSGTPGAAPTRLPAWGELPALGLAGPVASVDAGLQAVGSSHQLTTTIQPSCPLDSNQKHNSTAQDLCTPSAFLAPVWTYLAGVPAV